jgi:hypothetical protein
LTVGLVVVVGLLVAVVASRWDAPHDQRALTTETRPSAPAAVLVDDAAVDGAPAGSRAFVYSYLMPGVSGATVRATALLVTPLGDAPTGGWPVVVWGHPTRGLADECAPSLDGPASIPGLAALLAEGWAVLAPDYEGLGGDGLHPYLVSASEGASILDALATAPLVDDGRTGISVGSPVVLYGFSQGGHAVGAAAELAAARVETDPAQPAAPDLRGVAVVNPVSDPLSFARGRQAAGQFGVVATITAGQATADERLSLADLLGEPGARRAGVLLRTRCIGEVVDHFDATGPADPPTIDDLPDLVAALKRQQLGRNPLPVGVAAFVAQGLADTTVSPADTEALASRWCERGTAVTVRFVAGAGHDLNVLDELIVWMRERFASPVTGAPATSTPPDPPGNRSLGGAVLCPERR